MKINSSFLSLFATMAACTLVTVTAEKNSTETEEYALSKNYLCRTSWCASQMDSRRLESVSSTKTSQDGTARRLLDGVVVLDFEDLVNGQSIGGFYNHLGIDFSANTLALVDSDAAPEKNGEGNFANEPSP